MLKRTYDKIYALFDKAGGYLSTRTMLDHKVSTIHIRELVENGDIEKVSHGNYWGCFLKIKKPANYRMIEACLTNAKSVICGPSACYYHGFLKREPEKLYIATLRTDRGGMKLSFPVSRHYFSEQSFEEDVVTFAYENTTVRVYDIDRSVVDCIRLADKLEDGMLDEILRAYRRSNKKNLKKCYAYADRMRVGKIVREYLN
ncbi:MAG: type IV toxin-antitoxin system AbiEi family antitoxin domain-containing protein [Eubacterium sp.]|nr:type IV toxin-antitoxin system AbiEi family antitoxin domain-containing protein [Eubacterium sp.]